MIKMKGILAIMLGVVISFTACNEDDELSPEEIAAQQAKELIEEITQEFYGIASKTWAYNDFQPSEQMVTASATDDIALQRINAAKGAKKLDMTITITKDGDAFKPSVEFGLPEAELKEKILEIINEPYVEAYGFPIFSELTDEEYLTFLADYRRVLAAPFAADDLNMNQITDDATGRCIFTIELKDYAAMEYDDIVLNQTKFIKGNNDKIYLNTDGTLTVETTDTDYGVSKLILKEVTE